jgi:hypothetical protein
MHVLENNGPVECEEVCSEQGYTVFGLQYTKECFCGDEYDNIYREGVAPEEECDYECPDLSGFKCGGFNRMNVYDIHTSIRCSVGFKAEKCQGGYLPDVECNGECDAIQCCINDTPSPTEMTTGTSSYHVRRRG